MAETLLLEAEKREGRGSRGAARVRAQGKVPGIVYGHKEANVQVAFERKPLIEAIYARTRVFDVRTGDKVETVLIRELQWDHLGKELLHIDLVRVSKDERIEVRVPIELRGTAPGVAGGGIQDQPLHSLHIECPATNIPQSIRVNIAELQIGGVIHVSDVKVPEGVKVLDAEDAVVVQVTAPRVEAEEAGEEGAQAEPEVIGRKVEEEEEEK